MTGPYPPSIWVKQGVQRQIWEIPRIDLELQLKQSANGRGAFGDWQRQSQAEIVQELHRRVQIWAAYRNAKANA